jgi:ribosomal protein S18 acetylase RimI-like enzyme
MPRKGADSWYHENVRGPLEFLSFQVEDRTTSKPVGSARIWEMEPFSVRWNESAVGIVDVRIAELVRRQGVARLLLGNVMRFLHDQYFTLVEAQVDPANTAGVGLFRGLGFQQIDVGRQYRKR